MMFILECVDHYDKEKHGPILEVQREDGTGPMDDPDEIEVCEKCGKVKHYMLTRNEPGIADGDYSHTSASLAINPCQARAHKKLFPGIGIKNDGQLHFDSVKKQSDYLDKTGFQKKPQKKEY